MSVSWVLTSVMYVFGILYSNYDKGDYHVVYWHDYLPWYPVYIVNLLFDTATIFITIKILERIRGRGLFKSVSGIFTDALIAYTLLVLCVLSFDISTYLFKLVNIGTQWSYHHYELETRAINYSDKLSANLFFIGYEREAINDIFKLGFTEKAKIKYLGPDNLSNIKETIEVFPEAIIKFFKKETIDIESVFMYEITESDKIYLSTLRGPSSMFSSIISTAMTTFLPTLVYLLILLMMYISKEIIYVTRQFSLRFLKSAVENAAGETFDVSKFKPGLHFGILLGVLSALVKLVIELAKMA